VRVVTITSSAIYGPRGSFEISGMEADIAGTATGEGLRLCDPTTDIDWPGVANDVHMRGGSSRMS
jgi:hypothetical protein